MRNPTRPPPGAGRETKRTCCLKRQESEISFSPLLEPPWRLGPVPLPVGCLVRLTKVRQADFEAAHGRENRQVGQTTQAEQHAAGGVELTGDLPKQPPVDREDGDREGRDADVPVIHAR